MSKSPVVVFAPYSAIWSHALPEALVASALEQAGSKIIYVTCDGMMEQGCYAMAAYKINTLSSREARAQLCSMCRKRRDALSSGLGAKVITTDSLLPTGVKEEMTAFVDKVKISDIMALSVDGFNVGRIAMHETIIHFKLQVMQ